MNRFLQPMKPGGPVRRNKVGNRFLGALKGLKIRALAGQCAKWGCPAGLPGLESIPGLNNRACMFKRL
jgi:hypothetical protein